MMSLFDEAYVALTCCDPVEKCHKTLQITADSLDPNAPRNGQDASIPGRPKRPELVPAATVPRRGLGTLPGRAAFIHAVAHIEFNAINLALDAVWRFAGMPEDFYRDWLSVAQDEARHFQMLSKRLDDLGYHYGDFPAHNGLWEAAEKTAHDVLVRMALVPRVLEARGLDVTPGLMHRLSSVGDVETVAILEVILREEVRHVAIGTRWFRYLCDQRGLNSETTFPDLLVEYRMRLNPPFNFAAREAAGFTPRELATLTVSY